MSKAPPSMPVLDQIARVVLAYRPKPKSKAARKRKRMKSAIDKAAFWPDRPLRYADLFCGIGGFHTAADSLDTDTECVFACDIDESCRTVYKANYGLEPKPDIRTIEAKDIPDMDILLAGFPCQPFSIIGSREGFADARGTLFFEIARPIAAKKPM